MRLSSVEAIARALDEAGVRFIVVGGLAVNAHGYPRQTQDIDMVIPLDRDTVLAAFSTLAGLGYSPRIPVTAEGFADPRQRERWIEEKGMTVLSMQSDVHRETPIDIFVTDPFDFPTEYERAMVEEISPGVTLHIVDLSTLLDLKRRAGRPQDLADIHELRQLHEEGPDE